MRILFQNRKDAFDDPGGDTTQMLETRDALTKLGVEVDVSLEREPDVTGYDLVHIFNIQTADYGLAQLHNTKRAGLPVAVSTVFWDTRYVLRSNESFRYIPTPTGRLLSGIHPALPRLYYNIRSYRARRRIAASARNMLSEADVLFPNSFAELEILARSFGLPAVRGKAVVVPNGVRTDEEIDDGEPADDLPSEYVLEVAKYAPIKGQLALIKALMEHAEIPLVFVGGELDSLYGQECRRLGERRGNTCFSGYVPHDWLSGFYKRARVHALPSLRESPGLSTLEAAVNGANCVVSIHGPIVEYFGQDAWFCDPESIGSLREAVLNAWYAPRDERLGRRVRADFTWDKAARVTLDGYERILGGNR